MNDWLKLAFLGIIAWLAWRVMQALGATGPAAVYSFGDIISAPTITAAAGGSASGVGGANPQATDAKTGLELAIEEAARRGGLVNTRSATGAGAATGGYTAP